MKIERRSLLSGAEGAEGIVVVIDVLRAFTCSALMFHYGIDELVLVRTPEEALDFRHRDSSYLVAGEVKGVMVEGFDIGNSPKEFVEKGEAYFRSRKVVLRSSAGTQGVLAACASAKEVILGSYMTASAIARYIQDMNQEALLVTMLGMGLEATKTSVEDERCGDYIEYLLSGKPYDHLNAIWECLTDPFMAKSLRGDRPHMPREDVILALQRDMFDFVMVGRPTQETVTVQRIDVSLTG